jgi:hypothetical protein
LAGLGLPLVDSGVAGDGKDPGVEGSLARVEGVQLSQGALENPGGQVIGQVGVGADVAEIFIDGRVITVELFGQVWGRVGCGQRQGSLPE